MSHVLIRYVWKMAPLMVPPILLFKPSNKRAPQELTQASYKVAYVGVYMARHFVIFPHKQ